MRTIDTREYVSALREITEEGHDVNMIIAGNSMSPFLIHQRDTIWFRKVDRRLKLGDMVFYQRENGQFVMHRICRIREGQYYMVGDAQTEIEGPISEEQIFARVFQVMRKGVVMTEKSLWWRFFEKVWIRIIPIRPAIWSLYGCVCGRRE